MFKLKKTQKPYTIPKIGDVFELKGQNVVYTVSEIDNKEDKIKVNNGDQYIKIDTYFKSLQNGKLILKPRLDK